MHIDLQLNNADDKNKLEKTRKGRVGIGIFGGK